MARAAKSKFRTYLSTLTRRLLIDRYRAAAARHDGEHADIAEMEDLSSGDDPGELIDAKWRVACRMAAERRASDALPLCYLTRFILPIDAPHFGV